MRSRFITDSDSETTAAITANDVRLLQLLNKYPYLPSTYIVRLLNLNPTTYNRRFTILRHELKLIEPPLASWAASNARYRPAVYALTARGQRELKTRSLEVERAHTLTNFAHDFMSCLIVASFELGAKQHGLSFFDWPYLKRRRACEQDDHRLQVSLPGDSDARVVAPDWSPFTVKGRFALSFYGVEADRHNEPIHRRLAEQSSLVRKFRACREITRLGLYRKLGLTNCFHLFATVSRPHEDRMREAVLRLTDGRGARDILFTTLPDFTSFESFPKPTDWALTKPWRRAGFPDFNILEELHGSANAEPDS